MPSNEYQKMRVTFFLKRGFQNLPPAFSQLLYLNDLGVQLTVYHGKNSEYINKIMDWRGIQHYTFNSDNTKMNLISRLSYTVRYTVEVRRILKKTPQDEILWFGSGESYTAFNDVLRNRKCVFSILELYGYNFQASLHHNGPTGLVSLLVGAIREPFLSTPLSGASGIICPEKHRAAIMQGRYKLAKLPYVMPNKPYEFLDNSYDDEVPPGVAEVKDKFLVLYQGVISRDRPLENIGKALSKLENNNVVFGIMGNISNDYQKSILRELQTTYKNTTYLGYFPSPQHLKYTRCASVGIAVYDYSCMDNIFCAPNKIYEYAKYGIPMLCSNNPGLVETVGTAGAGECIDYSNIDAILSGIQKILRDYETYKANAFKFYDSTNNKAVIESLLKDITKNEN